jgi:hypothetical protein
VILFGAVYVVVGVAFPNPPATDKSQFMWRLAAWLICAVAFAIHICLSLFRFGNTRQRTAFQAAASVAIGAFGLAVAANIHSLTAGRRYQPMLALALAIWPLLTGVPAFVVAFIAATVLTKLRLRLT